MFTLAFKKEIAEEYWKTNKKKLGARTAQYLKPEKTQMDSTCVPDWLEDLNCTGRFCGHEKWSKYQLWVKKLRKSGKVAFFQYFVEIRSPLKARLPKNIFLAKAKSLNEDYCQSERDQWLEPPIIQSRLFGLHVFFVFFTK